MNTLKRNAQIHSKPVVKYITVSGDVIMDVLYILFTNDLPYEIKTFNRNDNSILLLVSPDKQSSNVSEAIENIESIVTDYSLYYSGIPQGESLDDETK